VVNDIDLDSPKASTCLGGMIGQAVVFKVLPLSFLDARLDHLVASGKALKILSEFIRVIGSQTVHFPRDLANQSSLTLCNSCLSETK